MALVLETATDRSIELEDFLSWVRQHVTPRDPDSLIAAAPMMRALANNRRFLVDRLNEELLKGTSFQAGNEQTAQTILLGGGPGFVVRANIWTPLDQQRRDDDWQRQLFFYSVPHDHSFDFVTVGYYGPGYETDLYEYDGASVAGLPGEPVELSPRGREKLDQGKVMFYRASRDVHSQLPPEAFSISLNLLTIDKTACREQYYFDVDQRRLLAPVDTGSAGASFVCEAARHLGDDRTRSLLERVAATHVSGQARIAALDSMAALEPESRDRLWHGALQSPHPLVRHTARVRIDALAG